LKTSIETSAPHPCARTGLLIEKLASAINAKIPALPSRFRQTHAYGFIFISSKSAINRFDGEPLKIFEVGQGRG
jgi:hypothetical protein